VGSELGSVYGLPVVRVATHRPSRRQHLPDRIFATAGEKWDRIVERVAALHAAGVPVLLGTRSVASSELASRLLAERGLDHQLLSAKQDEEEARIVAAAGERGCITIATNMAGRGPDIKLGEGVAELGGLHVILSERHEAGRIDRQLEGRCARQGDPGCFEAFLSLEDPLLDPYRGGPLELAVRAASAGGGSLAAAVRHRWIRFAQRATEKAHSRIRKALLKNDRQMGDILSFSGRPE
jgi:preprotein translocase subunit SecA